MGAHTSRMPVTHSIEWYRTRIPAEVSSRVHETSDLLAAVQTLGWLSMLASWMYLAVYFSSSSTMLATIFALLYCAQSNFSINAMHELGHGFVFKTKVLNSMFLRIVSFLGWLHPDMFFSSHLQHHRFTQNPPHDLENPMPVHITLADFFAFGFVNIKGFVDALLQTVRAALGIYPTGHLGWLPEWEARLYASDPSARRPAMLWAWCLLIGHVSIAAACCSRGMYLVPLLVSLGPFINGWLFFLCNMTQVRICTVPPVSSNNVSIAFLLTFSSSHVARWSLPGQVRLPPQLAHILPASVHSILVLAHELAH
jgi:fatty acid desaturase